MPLPIVSAVERHLSGWPDHIITLALLAVAAVAVLVALFARPAIKPLVLAWMLAP